MSTKICASISFRSYGYSIKKEKKNFNRYLHKHHLSDLQHNVVYLQHSLKRKQIENSLEHIHIGVERIDSIFNLFYVHRIYEDIDIV